MVQFLHVLQAGNITTALCSSQIVGHKCTCFAISGWNAVCACMHLLIGRGYCVNGHRASLDIFSHTCGIELASFGHTASNTQYCQWSCCLWPAMHLLLLQGWQILPTPSQIIERTRKKISMHLRTSYLTQAVAMSMPSYKSTPTAYF